jgi:hypothetical protein
LTAAVFGWLTGRFLADTGGSDGFLTTSFFEEACSLLVAVFDAKAGFGLVPTLAGWEAGCGTLCPAANAGRPHNITNSINVRLVNPQMISHYRRHSYSPIAFKY